ncbi:MAG: EF-hand domain-containing protein [Pseudomonadota bacterium]
MTKLTVLPALAFALIATGASAQGPDKEAAAKNFKAADANEDRKLDKAEFRKFIDLNADDELGRAPMVKRFNMYDTAFGRLDTDKSGYVTADEVRAASQQ